MRFHAPAANISQVFRMWTPRLLRAKAIGENPKIRSVQYVIRMDVLRERYSGSPASPAHPETGP
jgi:hypothetical protein